MMDVQPVTLAGKCVSLELLNESHIPDLLKAGSDPSIWLFSWPSNQHQSDAMTKLIRDILVQNASATRLHFAVKHLQSNRIIGMTGYHNFQKEHYGLEIGGTWFVAEFQRTSVNTECKYLMLTHAFEVLHCVRVQFRIDGNNTKSTKAIGRIGAVQEGVLRNNYIVDGKCFDLNLYSVIIEEWPRLKLKLERMLSCKK